jgi:hypothetical protein
MNELSINNLGFRELLVFINTALEKHDELAEGRRSGIRLAQFVHYAGEPVIKDFIGVADWRDVDPNDTEAFLTHFAERLVQAGTCDSCKVEVVSYSKSAKCPVCFATVECT